MSVKSKVAALALGLTMGLVSPLPTWAASMAELATGERLAAEGDIAAALAHYQDLARRAPDSAEVHTRLGGMALINQLYAEAVVAYQKAISLGDKTARPFAGMGMAYVHMARYRAARAAFEQARDLKGGDSADLDRVLRWLDDRAGSDPTE